MAYVELAAAIYLGVHFTFLSATGWINLTLFKAPILPFTFALGADALSRLNLT